MTAPKPGQASLLIHWLKRDEELPVQYNPSARIQGMTKLTAAISPMEVSRTIVVTPAAPRTRARKAARAM